MRHIYDKYNLSASLGPDPTEKQVTNDKTNFIKQVLQNLYVFPVYDAAEFNLAVRSLGSFFKKHKSIGLVCIDGIHFIEN